MTDWLLSWALACEARILRKGRHPMYHPFHYGVLISNVVEAGEWPRVRDQLYVRNGPFRLMIIYGECAVEVVLLPDVWFRCWGIAVDSTATHMCISHAHPGRGHPTDLGIVSYHDYYSERDGPDLPRLVYHWCTDPLV